MIVELLPTLNCEAGYGNEDYPVSHRQQGYQSRTGTTLGRFLPKMFYILVE